MGQSAETTDWVSRFADEVIEESERRAPGKPVVVASGLSPSGPIHLGNLREVMCVAYGCAVWKEPGSGGNRAP